MSFGNPQLWLLLWKDYLIRKRKPVTIGGIVWAAATIISLVIVRSNVYPDKNPTCQFASRALPSAGVLPFLQSFICTINNECDSLDKYEEIPNYNKSRLYELHDQFSPIFNNETIMETVKIIPNSIKLLSTVTRVIDNQEIRHIVYDGFKVQDIFKDPEEVASILSQSLAAPNKIFRTFLASSINFQNVLEKLFGVENVTCNEIIFNEILISDNSKDISDFAQIICKADKSKLEQIIYSLFYEINTEKYIRMIGDIFYELTRKNTIKDLGNMLNSLIKLSNLENYIPMELKTIRNMFYNSSNTKFSYVDSRLIHNIIYTFEPLFEESDVYKTILNSVNIITNGIKSLKNTFVPRVKNENNEVDQNSQDNGSKKLYLFIDDITNIVQTLQNIINRNQFSAMNIIDVFGGILEVVVGILPKESKHEVFYYATLIDKMLSGVYNTLTINLHMEEKMFNATMRHPKAVEKISKLGPIILNKVIDGLTDVDRVQILTRKIYYPGQMFCDLFKLQTFLKISKEEAMKIKPIVCDSVWKNYIIDVIETFGVNNISSTINKMASFIVSETLGKDNEQNFIKIQDFILNIRNFITYVVFESTNSNNKTIVNWESLFKNENYHEIKAAFKSKSNQINTLLVTVNTALAREVISSNAILETYITPTLIKLKISFKSISQDIEKIPKDLLKKIKENIVGIIEIVLNTITDKEKTLNLLTSNHTHALCNLVENCLSSPKECDGILKNNTYINYPSDKDILNLTSLLCDVSKSISSKLDKNLKDDQLFTTLYNVANDSELGKGSEVNWSEFISILKKLYLNIDTNFGFLLRLNENIDADELKNLKKLNKEVVSKHFSNLKINDIIQYGFSGTFNILQVLDNNLFNMNQNTSWKSVKNDVDKINNLFYVTNQFLKIFKAIILFDDHFELDELPLTSKIIKDIFFNLPPLISEITNFISTEENPDIQSIINIMNNENNWPCFNNSVTNILNFQSNATVAIKAIETVLCVDEDLKNEWNDFSYLEKLLDMTNNSSSINITINENIFIKTARAFNNLIDGLSNFHNFSRNLILTKNESQKYIKFIDNLWKQSTNIMDKNNFNITIMRNFLRNVNTLLTNTKIYDIDMSYSAAKLWETSIECFREKSVNNTITKCRRSIWNAIKFSIIYIAMGGEQMVADLTEYFDEMLEPEVNVLQLIGFTKKTGPFVIFDKLPDLIDAVVNSFSDQKFMKQIYRSLGKRFWDCERILDSIVILPHSKLTRSNINSMKAYICPSFIHWVSIPINENVLLDIFAKSQLLFFSTPVSEFNVTFENLLDKSLILHDLISKFSNKQNFTYTFITEEWISKFQNIGQTLSSYNNDAPEKLFGLKSLDNPYVKNILKIVYLTEITRMLNFIDKELKSFHEANLETMELKNKVELKNFMKLFGRKFPDMIEIFLMAFTEKLSEIDKFEDFRVVESLEKICNNNTENKISFNINLRTLKGFCNLDYKKFLELSTNNNSNSNTSLENYIEEFWKITTYIVKLSEDNSKENLNLHKKLLLSLVETDIPEQTNFLKMNIKYAFDFNLNGYLQYLNMKLENCLITLDFVTGNDWWSTIKEFYNNTYTNVVIDAVENSPIIIEDILNNVPKMKIIRLIKDIKYNDTALLCNSTISEYIPDSTGEISKIQNLLCNMNLTMFYKEIKPIKFAAYVYDNGFVENKEIDPENFNYIFEKMKVKITQMENGLKTPRLPDWITNETISKIKGFFLPTMKESNKIDFIFFFLNNFVDGITLFMNSTYNIPSTITPWIKQINLQLIKKDEYVTLLCDIRNMHINDVYALLINDFHWDLALNEIASNRNYTWIEMNKSINHLIEQVRLHIRDINYGQLNKLSECIQNTSVSNPFNKLSLYVTIGSNVMKLIRASSLHFKNIEGFTSSSMWQYYFSIMKNRIPVYVDMDLVTNSSIFDNYTERLSADLRNNSNWKIDINQISSNKSQCEIQNNEIKLVVPCTLIQISNISNDLENLQRKAFWSMNWFSNIIFKIEDILLKLGHIVRKLSVINWQGLSTNKIQSVIDLVLQVTQKTFLENIAQSLNDIISQLHPLIENLEIETALKDVTKGLNQVNVFMVGFDPNYLKFEMNKWFHNWDHITSEVQTKTNVTLMTLNTMQNATWNLEPMFNADSDNIHIKEWICKSSLFSMIFLTSNDTFQTNLYKTRSELCGLSDPELDIVISTLFQNVNYTTVIDNVVEMLTSQVIDASNLTRSDGDAVIENIGNVFKLIPSFQNIISNISRIVANEPLIKSFQKSSSFSSLLYDPNFFTNIGNMLCGKPFKVNISRFYKVIAEVKDSITEPDHKQINSLPNDFCKDLYREILKMDGGKILWTYAKPMLMGKILYTPNREEFQKIIFNANETFANIGDLFSLVHNFSNGFASIEDIVTHNISLFTMQKLLQSESIQNKFAEFFGESTINISEVNLCDVIDNLKNTTTMKIMLMKLSDMAKCISLNRFEQVDNEKLLEKRASELMENNEFSAGVVFLSETNYKIRMDIDNVPSTSRIKNRFWMPGPNANFIEHLRYFRGFIQLQDMIEKAIISTATSKTQQRISKRAIYADFNLSDWEIHTQQMPYPCYVQDEFKTILYESQALIIAFFFSLILVVASIVRNLVWERESGNTSLMCVMRMKRNNHTLSWFLISFIEILVVMIVLSLILKVGNILPKSNPIVLLAILFNFGFSVVMFCYMVTSFFKSASLAAVSAVIIYLIFFMPYVIVISLEAVLTFPQKLATSLFMSTGFCYSLLLIARFEVQGIGLQWHNINESPLVDDPISVLNTCFIVFVDGILYFIIGYIINHLRFGEKINVDYIADSLNELSVGVKIKNISKIFKGSNKQEIKALDDINIDLYKGQITTLLGRNGAGKTTLIKILTGTLKPNSGNIIINRQSNVENSGDEKNYIGLCPQSDILLEFLTSREHLIYYARLKTNLSSQKIKCDVDSMLETMGLTRLSEEPVYKLSGGLRRRLSVGLAFIANPHLVILDEPSSGVDPVARRDIWSLIVSLKGSRTILLTTHHLDEAELLSDNLIIMHKGKVLTHNSPLELKNKYGSGYSLAITYRNFTNANSIMAQNGAGENKKNNSNVEILNESDYEYHDSMEKMKVNANELMKIIKPVITNCTLQNVSTNSIDVNFPFVNEEGQSQNISKALLLIEEKKSFLNYSNVTIDSSNLEQVFLDICKNADSENTCNDIKISDIEKNENSISSSSISENNIDGQFNKLDTSSLVDEENILKATFVLQILTLLKKRFLHYRRNYRLLIITLLLPAVFVAVAMGFSLIRPPDDSEDPLQMSSSLYSKFSAEFVSFSELYSPNMNNNKIINTLMDNSVYMNNRSLEYWKKNTQDCKCTDGYQKCKLKNEYENDTFILPKNKMVVLPSTKHAVDWMVNTQDIYTEKRYGGWSAVNKNQNSSNSFLVWYNNKGDHALPSYVNTLNSAILKNKLNKDANITLFSHPLKLSQEQLSRSSLLQHVADVGIGVVLLIGFSLVPAGGVIYLVNERIHQEKRLQLLCGVSPFTYWFSTLLWDIIITCGAIVLAICVFEIFGLPIYLYKDNIPAISILLLLYGISCSSLMHILEKIFTDASLANMILFCSNVFVGVVGLTILLIIDVLSTSDQTDHIRWVLHKIFLIFPQFALGDGLVEISKNTIQAILLSRFGMNTYISPLKWELMGNHYLSLTLTAILFFSINMCYEYDLFDFIFAYFQRDNKSSLDFEDDDYDVLTEKYRVELATLKPHYNMGFNDDMASSKNDKFKGRIAQKENNDTVQIISLKKIYKGVLEKRVAVDNLTFGLKSAQCFGLLGVNGAGKSTTFKMLTGELKPTYGNIYINGKIVKQKDLCNGSIAYCPQVDSLDNLLTVYEHLEFYSQLRGLVNKKNKIKDALEELDLSKYVHQKSSTLSGGNKRKLCTAISLLGNAPLVLLDEPTSGMDPGARYITGNAIKKSLKAGRCLLLSSHSLAECESLCQRVAVMAFGKFLAIGPPNYLKNKFGGGYLVSIRLASPNQKGQLIQFMTETFPFVQVQNSHYCTTQFLISLNRYSVLNNSENGKNEAPRSGKISLSDIFLGLNKISSKLNLIDYSVNQSSLDQVFINFSHHQPEKNVLSNDTNGQIKLSTLERQYSKKDVQINTNNDEIYVTKF